MLKLCSDISELDFLPADPFCAKITAPAITYGFEKYDSFRFYYQGNTAALSFADGNVTLWCNEEADFDEIKEFLQVTGYSSLLCNEDYISKIVDGIDDSSFIVKYEGSDVVKPINFTYNADYKSIYNLLTVSGFDMGDYTSFLADVVARINKSTATCGAIVADKTECCAFRLFEGAKSVLLGAVATLPECRGKGLASSLVPYMAQGDKTSFLFCRNDGLRNFYEKCGFTVTGRWAVKYNNMV